MSPRDWDRLDRRAAAAGMSPHGFAVAVLMKAGTLVDPLRALDDAKPVDRPHASDIGF